MKTELLSFEDGVLWTIKSIEKCKMSTKIKSKYIIDENRLRQLKEYWTKKKFQKGV